MKFVLKGRTFGAGYVKGEALVSHSPISFAGSVDPISSTVVEKGHELFGKKVRDKILVFPTGKGSTVGSWVILRMSALKSAPIGIINVNTDEVILVGAIIAGIPLVDNLNRSPLETIRTGDFVEIDAQKGTVNVTRNET